MSRPFARVVFTLDLRAPVGFSKATLMAYGDSAREFVDQLAAFLDHHPFVEAHKHEYQENKAK